MWFCESVLTLTLELEVLLTAPRGEEHIFVLAVRMCALNPFYLWEQKLPVDLQITFFFPTQTPLMHANLRVNSFS